MLGAGSAMEGAMKAAQTGRRGQRQGVGNLDGHVGRAQMSHAASVAAAPVMPPVRGRLTAARAAGAASSGSRPAARPSGCSSRRTWTISPTSCAELDPAVPVMALGLGSNLIVRDGGVPGVVVRLGKAFAKVRCESTRRAACGRRRVGHPVPSTARDAGIAGLEFLRGDPRHGRRRRADERRRLWPRAAECWSSATVVLRDRASASRLAGRRRCGYSYRHSELPPGAIVVAALFAASPASRQRSAPRWTASPPSARRRSRCARAPAARPSRTRRAKRPGR